MALGQAQADSRRIVDGEIRKAKHSDIAVPREICRTSVTLDDHQVVVAQRFFELGITSPSRGITVIERSKDLTTRLHVGAVQDSQHPPFDIGHPAPTRTRYLDPTYHHPIQ